jgi:ATP phosphoribosyltransferase
MLRVAVPNKGSLSDDAVAMLREAGYLARPVGRALMVADPEHGAEFFFLRPRDIATYVGEGQLDLGITGRDLLLDAGAPADVVLELGFAPSTFRFAVPKGSSSQVQDLQGQRIATSYPGLVGSHLTALGVQAQVVRLDGAVENAVALGVADAVADVVDTGATLRAAGLEIIGEPILRSEAVLIRRQGAEVSTSVEQFVRRIQGVLVARSYVMMDYDVTSTLVEQACALTPGIESPTVSPLHEKGWVAVRSMVPRKDQHRVMDELWELGARGIIVTDIHACRL